MSHQVRYCVTEDGARIAYSVSGKGSPVIRTSHWLTHLHHDPDSPIWRHVIQGFSRRHTLVRYDPRGEGLSDRSRTDISFEAWVRDLEGVVDAVKFPKFVLFGASQGAATAIAYAVRHPERVSHLILYGGFARGFGHRSMPVAQHQELELARALVRQGWGQEHESHRQWFTTRFMPDGTAEQYHDFNMLQKVSASPEVAEKHLMAVSEIDVRALLPQVRTPTLVLHSRDDVIAPFADGEELAANIPGARLVPLEGSSHLFLAGTPAHRVFVDAVNDFLGDPPLEGPLPGTHSFGEGVAARIGLLEQNWLVKAAVLAGALIGLGISLRELAKALL